MPRVVGRIQTLEEILPIPLVKEGSESLKAPLSKGDLGGLVRI